MTDHRICRRDAQSAGKPVFYRHEHTLKQYGAVLINHGDGGICLQTGYEMKPGRRIRIMESPEARAHADDQPEPGRLALIKWCHKLPESLAFFYQVGVAFVEEDS